MSSRKQDAASLASLASLVAANTTNLSQAATIFGRFNEDLTSLEQRILELEQVNDDLERRVLQLERG